MKKEIKMKLSELSVRGLKLELIRAANNGHEEWTPKAIEGRTTKSWHWCKYLCIQVTGPFNRQRYWHKFGASHINGKMQVITEGQEASRAKIQKMQEASRAKIQKMQEASSAEIQKCKKLPESKFKKCKKLPGLKFKNARSFQSRNSKNARSLQSLNSKNAHSLQSRKPKKCYQKSRRN